MTEPDTTGPVRPLPDPHGPEKPPKANDVRRALNEITARTAAIDSTGRPPRADGADIIRDLRRQLVQEHEAAEWRQKCIDEAIAAIHDAPQEIAPLLPPVAPADLPRAVRALIDRARSQLAEARAALRQAEQERDEARREWRGLIDRIRTDASARGLDIEPGEDLVDGLLRIIDDRGKDRDDWQRQAEAVDSLRAEVERHAGAQCGCDTNGECLARLYQQAHALVATAPETAPESPQTDEQTQVRADTHTEPQTGSQRPLAVATGRPLRAPDPALVDGQRVLIEAEVCAGGQRIHTIRPQQFGKIVYLDLAEVVVHRDLPVQAVMDRIDVTAAELRRQIDTIAGALNDGARDALRAAIDRLATTLDPNDTNIRAWWELQGVEFDYDEAEVTPEQVVDYALTVITDARTQVDRLTRDLAEVNAELEATEVAHGRDMEHGLQEHIKYKRLLEGVRQVAERVETTVHDGRSLGIIAQAPAASLLNAADRLRALLDGADTPTSPPGATETAETGPAQAQDSTGTQQPPEAVYCRECGASTRAASRMALCPDCHAPLCSPACLDEHRGLGTCPDDADGVLGDATPGTVRMNSYADAIEAIIAAHGPAHAVSAEAGRLRAEAAMLRARVREWEAVNSDLAERCDSGDIPIRLGERYSLAVLREIDRLRTERDRLMEELPEDNTIVAAIRRLRAARSATPDTRSAGS